jgi:hypothetical protein
MSSINVKDIVKEFLRSEGCDGLYNPGLCSCTLPDIAPCDNMQSYCKPGWVIPCNGIGCDDCGQDHIGDHDTFKNYLGGQAALFGTAFVTSNMEEQACMIEQILAEAWGLA